MSETLTQQIGEQLKSARLVKHLTLDDIQDITKIQVKYLEAIETNNLSVLPGDFYVRAFIRQYAMAVNLNPEEVLGETRPASISRTNNLTRAHRDTDGVVRAGKETKLSTKSRLSNMLPSIWIGFFVVVVLILVWFGLTRLSQSGQQPNDTDKVSVSNSSVPTSSSNKSVQSSKSVDKKTTKKSEKVVKLGTPEQNTALQTTIYNISGQSKNTHHIKVSAQGSGTNVKISIGSNVLLNELVTTNKAVDIPAGSESVNVQFSNVSNAVMTFDDEKVSVISSATPFWNVLFNLNQ